MNKKRDQAEILSVDGVLSMVIPIRKIGYINLKAGMFPEGSVIINFRIDVGNYLDIMECDDLKKQIDHVQNKKRERERDDR